MLSKSNSKKDPKMMFFESYPILARQSCSVRKHSPSSSDQCFPSFMVISYSESGKKPWNWSLSPKCHPLLRFYLVKSIFRPVSF